MADALVERRPTARFFCHRCNVEFEDVLQDYTCPYCASGFIEQLETEPEAPTSGDEFSDADMSNLDDVSNLDEMSNLDDSDDVHQNIPPMLNDLAFLLSGGGRVRGTGRRETLMEQLVWMISGARGGNAPAPLVLVGAPGDYVFGGEGLDAVVTQLLGQLEAAGPPPLPRDQIAALPTERVSPAHPAANTACSVCWEDFLPEETISRLECDHIFHSRCITPWLQLHATCPICRRSLLPASATAAAAPADSPQPAPPHSQSDDTSGAPLSANSSDTSSVYRSQPRVLVRRATLGESSSGSSDTGSPLASVSATSVASVTSAPSAPSVTSATSAMSVMSATSATSHSTSDAENMDNMDMEFD